ncbi:MAG TPA: DNA gyrase modulator [Mycobacteriales bacterium]
MFEVAEAAVEAALAAGARYADARAMHQRAESMAARNGQVEDLVQRESVGVGVRALVGSSWGFVAVPDPTDAEARRAGEQAAAVARASALVPGPDVSLVPIEVRQDSWVSPCEEDPLSVPLGEKGDLVAGVTATMRAAGASLAEASYLIWDTAKWFVSSEGSRIDQRIRECGAAMNATAIGAGETQRRSYPGIRGSTAPAAGSWSARSTCPATPSGSRPRPRRC